jgi:hypothetical protein
MHVRNHWAWFAAGLLPVDATVVINYYLAVQVLHKQERDGYLGLPRLKLGNIQNPAEIKRRYLAMVL